MKNKREEFIDFGLWLFNNSHRALTIGQFVDEYLSINSSQIDVETLGSNERDENKITAHRCECENPDEVEVRLCRNCDGYLE